VKKFLYSTTAILFSLAPLAARAQETTVVTATRVPTPLNQVASSITVIDRAEIEARQLRSLSDILATVPGLNVVRAGGLGAQTSLFTRGTESNHAKILLDGIDIADTSTPGGVTDLGKLVSADIARVEVLRGPQSGLYGSDAIGGVVNIITRAGQGPLTLDASAEAGSFDTTNQSAAISGTEGSLQYRATLSHDHAGATPVTPLNLLPPGQVRNDDYFDNVTAGAKLGLDVAPGFDLGLTARWSQSLSKVTGDAFDFVTFASFPAPLRTRVAGQTWASRGTAHWNLGWLDQTLGFAYSSGQTRTDDPNNGPGANSGDRVKLDWQGNVVLGEDHLLVLGAETARDAVHLPLSAGYTTNAGFAELNSDFGHGIYTSASLRYDSNSQFGDKLTWRIAPSVAIGETGFRLKGSAGTAGQRPQFCILHRMSGRGCFDHPVERRPAARAGDEALQRGVLRHALHHVTDLVAGELAERAKRVEAGAGDHHPAQPADGVLTDRCAHGDFFRVCVFPDRVTDDGSTASHA